jgi:hypothetical protein
MPFAAAAEYMNRPLPFQLSDRQFSTLILRVFCGADWRQRPGSCGRPGKSGRAADRAVPGGRPHQRRGQQGRATIAEKLTKIINKYLIKN